MKTAEEIDAAIYNMRCRMHREAEEFCRQARVDKGLPPDVPKIGNGGAVTFLPMTTEQQVEAAKDTAIIGIFDALGRFHASAFTTADDAGIPSIIAELDQISAAMKQDKIQGFVACLRGFVRYGYHEGFDK